MKGRSQTRGTTLVEGMAACAILAVGILGTMQTLIISSQQNAVAAKMVRASQIAAQVRTGLEMQHLGALTGTGGVLNAANCTTLPGVIALTDGLSALTSPAPCVVDLDIFDNGAIPTQIIAPGFQREDWNPTAMNEDKVFRRILVASQGTGVLTVTVVVSFMAGAQRYFVRQTGAYYDPVANGSGSEI